MIREIIEEIKLKKVSSLIETMQLKDFNSKVEAFNKLEKMKITKEIGLFLIESAKFDYGIKDGNGGISSSLLSLCFKEYYDEYTEELKKIYKFLDDDAKERLVLLLSSIDNESALKLYVELVLKNYADKDYIPIGNLNERPYMYSHIFPKLFKALKFKETQNNILILVSDYLNAGVVREEDLKKNKKIIQEAIIKVFEAGLKFPKFTNTTKALQNNEYFDLRFYLELAVNIEFYVSNRKTEDCLKKLFEKNDNQLKLFILDNFIRKNKNVSKFKLEPLAKDETSRYPLYEMLNIYDKTNLMPKKYLDQKLLAKSDFYINFMISTRYEEAPKSFKFLCTKEIDDYIYYVFKFKHSYTYDNTPGDYATTYIMEQSGLDKYKNKTETKEFIGISGGYLKKEEPWTLAFNHRRLLCSVIEKNVTEDEIIDKLTKEIEEDIIQYKKQITKEQKKSEKYLAKNDKKQAKDEKKQKVKEEKEILKAQKKEEKLKKEEENKLLKEQKEEKKKKILEEKQKLKEQKLEESNKIKEQSKLEKNKKQELEKPKEDKIEKQKIKEEKKDEKKQKRSIKKEERKKHKEEKRRLKEERIERELEQEKEKENRFHFHFYYILMFLFFIFVSLLVFCVICAYDSDILNFKINKNSYVASKLEKEDLFKEIDGHDIYNQEQNEYYVLFYKKGKKEKRAYYTFLNDYIKHNAVVYYVNLEDEKNKFLFENNDLNFVITNDRFLKVLEKDFEYYVDGKNNILFEMKNQANAYKKADVEEKKQKEAEDKENAEKEAMAKVKMAEYQIKASINTVVE